MSARDVEPRDASRVTATVLVARLASMGVVFAGSIALTRLLGAEDRGAHGWAVAVITILSTALAFGIPVGGYVLATHRATPVSRLAANGSLHSVVAGIAAGAIGMLLAAVGLVPLPLQDIAGWPWIMAVGAAGFVLNAHLIQLSLALGRAVHGAVLAFLPYLVAAVGYIGLWAMRGTLGQALWIFALAAWLPAIGMAVMNVRRTSAVAPDLGLGVNTLRQGVRNYPGELAQLAQQRAAVLMIGVLAPAAAVGVYVVAYQTAEPLLAISSAAGAVILASGMASDDVRRGGTTARLIRETLLLAGLLTLVAGVVAPFAIPALYGPEFTASVAPFLVLLPATLALTIARLAMADLARRNRLGITTAVASTVLVVNLGLSFVLIPSLGALGAAIATATSYVLTCAALLTAEIRIGAFSWGDLAPRSEDVRQLSRAWAVGWGRLKR